MKRIRTILSFYNGCKYIDDQLNSIFNQKIPDGFSHEIFVYDDGSSDEEHNVLYQKWGKRVKIIKCKNRGVTFRFLSAIVDAKKSDIDYVFLADQDDIFLQNKYANHLATHLLNRECKIVISRSMNWMPDKNNLLEKRRLNIWDGHRISINMNAMNDWDLDAFQNRIDLLSKTSLSKKYHDFFVGIFFAILSEKGPIFIDETLTHYRIHNSSVTNSSNISKSTLRIWRNNYDYYFNVMKPLFSEAKQTKLKISDYNRAFVYFDYNYMKKGKRWLSFTRYYWNNLSMYVRCKWMRNI